MIISLTRSLRLIPNYLNNVKKINLYGKGQVDINRYFFASFDKMQFRNMMEKQMKEMKDQMEEYKYSNKDFFQK